MSFAILAPAGGETGAPSTMIVEVRTGVDEVGVGPEAEHAGDDGKDGHTSKIAPVCVSHSAIRGAADLEMSVALRTMESARSRRRTVTTDALGREVRVQ